MVRIHPFAAIRPVPGYATKVASLPYDVMSTVEARAMVEGNPHSFLRVVRSEVDLPPEVSPGDPQVYERAASNLARLQADGILIRDRSPHLYLYRQVRDHRAQVGVVCCCHVEDYQQGLIKRHENTRPDKEDDRTRHVLATNANTGPVFLAHRPHEGIATLVASEMNDRPLYHFDAPDGVTHTVWQVKNASALIEAFGELPATYVADGHHRAASAARASAERAAANPDHRGDEEYNWFLTAIFPADELTVLPYHRLVKDLNQMTPALARQALGAVGQMERTDEPVPEKPGRFGVYLESVWYRCIIDPKTVDYRDPIASLDAELLQTRILEPVLGIGDPRTDPRIEFVGGIRGPEELKRRVDSGTAAIAFALHPTSLEQLFEVADADLIMPPKSTWFEPKLRSGLFVHSLD